MVLTISIRAPARGATVGIDHGDNRLIISIRAPARGATGRRNWHTMSSAYFNPRSREGSDLYRIVSKRC